MTSGGQGGRPGRGRRSLRDYVVVLWFVAAIVVSLVHRWVPESTWLMVHLIALGAITHSIMVWSAHFTAALLKTRADDDTRRRADRRLLLLALGSALPSRGRRARPCRASLIAGAHHQATGGVIDRLPGAGLDLAPDPVRVLHQRHVRGAFTDRQPRDP